MVAVLDSGVHARHPHIGEDIVLASMALDASFSDSSDRIGHGTAVAAAIHDIAPGAPLIVGKIFDRSLATNAAVLADGIAWAADRGARLINLSLGTANPAHEEKLRESIAHASDRGAIVVSARGTTIDWLPGGLPGVAAVLADDQLERHEFDLAAGTFYAAPFPRPIPGLPRERNLSGVSFAVANVTGLLARLLESRDNVRSPEQIIALIQSR